MFLWVLPVFFSYLKAKITGKKVRLKEVYEWVNEVEQILVDKEKDLKDFDSFLDLIWKLKSQMGAVVSTNSINILYVKGITVGALERLLGVGGGFFCFCRSEKHRSRYRDYECFDIHSIQVQGGRYKGYSFYTWELWIKGKLIEKGNDGKCWSLEYKNI